MKTNDLSTSGDQRVLVFPGQTSGLAGKRVHFLFSTPQVLDVLKELTVTPVPFSPPYLEGIAEWRDRVLPVISLEEYLELPAVTPFRDQRLMVIRRGEENIDDQAEAQGALRVASAIRMASLPIPCTPVSDELLGRRETVRGVYEWEEGLLLVVNVENLLSGAVQIDSFL
jgi:chemotaxis signal transduction protein